MARIRSIKPQFFVNDEVAALHPLDRILFIGLWTQADREGRLEDRPVKIKACVLPFDRCDIDAALTRLVNAHLIIRYEVSGSKYIQVINFAKHQHPHHKEPESLIPAPGKTRAKPRLIPENPVQAPGKTGGLMVNGLLSLDSGLSTPLNTRPPGGFDRFWNLYPKKKSKGQAEKAWKKIQPDELLQDRIQSALERAKASVEWQKNGGEFIPHPATWLNAKGWEDVYQQPVSSWRKFDPDPEPEQPANPDDLKKMLRDLTGRMK